MILTKNKKAFYDYEIIEKFTAGIVLSGYEVKAVKEGKVNFDSSFVQIIGNEVFLLNTHIGRYSKQSQEAPEQDFRRSRKLLLRKNEVDKLKKFLQQKGKTAVPLALLLNHGLIKLELAVVKGRKKHDKKDLEKKRQLEEDTQRQIKDLKVVGLIY